LENIFNNEEYKWIKCLKHGDFVGVDYCPICAEEYTTKTLNDVCNLLNRIISLLERMVK